MDWLIQNWFFILVLFLCVAMHFFGHGVHREHGGRGGEDEHRGHGEGSGEKEEKKGGHGCC